MIEYDAATDTLTVIIDRAPVESVEDAGNGVRLHYDPAGRVVRVEIVGVSKLRSGE